MNEWKVREGYVPHHLSCLFALLCLGTRRRDFASSINHVCAALRCSAGQGAPQVRIFFLTPPVPLPPLKPPLSSPCPISSHPPLPLLTSIRFLLFAHRQRLVTTSTCRRRLQRQRHRSIPLTLLHRQTHYHHHHRLFRAFDLSRISRFTKG